MTPLNWPADHRDILPDPGNGMTRAKDLYSRGVISLDEANVMMVDAQTVLIVNTRLPRHVRSALNAAVKAGKLAHLKRDGHKPEVYFRPQARDRAITIRQREAQKVMSHSRAVMVTQREYEALS